MVSCSELQQVLQTEIPLTRAMEIKVTQCNEQRVTLSAPLEPNINHKCTAFGGSLYAIAVLCGWGFIYQHMKLQQLTGHIVIQHSEVEYLLPVDGTIQASCKLEDKSVLDRFIKIYKRKGRSRIHLQTRITFHNKDAVVFNGQYVVHT